MFSHETNLPSQRDRFLTSVIPRAPFESSIEMAKPWVEIVKAKRLARDALIEQHRTAAAVSEAHTRITDIADVDALTKLYETKAITAEVVVRAYIQRSVSPFVEQIASV